MHYHKIFPTLVLGAVLFMGSSCTRSLSNIGGTLQNATPTDKMGEIEYYNLAIDQGNEVQDSIRSYKSDYESYLSLKAVNDEKTCDYSRPVLVEQSYTTAKKKLVDEKPEMVDAEKQKTVEEKVTPFLASYQALNDYAKEFEDYCDREQFKDDEGVKITEYETGFETKMNEAIDNTAALLKVVSDLQKNVDLGIDPNTTKPNEVAGLITDKLTTEIDTIYNELFPIYGQAIAEGQTADFVPVQQAFATLQADITTEQAHASSVGLNNDQILKAAFNSYMDRIDDFTTEMEKLTRDQEGGEITADNIADYDDSLLSAYNGVISAHNVLVQALSSYVAL
jgi:hypothetical protein